MGASGGHQQGQVFIVVTDRDRMARLAEIWRTVADIYEGWIGKADPRYGSDPLFIRTFDAIHYQRDHFHETPVVIVACYDQRVLVRRLKRGMRDFLAALRKAGSRRAAHGLRKPGAHRTAVRGIDLPRRPEPPARGEGARASGHHDDVAPDGRGRCQKGPRDTEGRAHVRGDPDRLAARPLRAASSRRPTEEVVRQDHW